MSAYDFNPHICLEVLQGITEEIPPGVRANDWIVPDKKINITQELLLYIQNSIITVTKNALDYVWAKYHISEKLKDLRTLEEKSPKYDAWRPVTGKVNLNSLKAKNLHKRKEELTKQIQLVQEQYTMIIPYLKEISERTQEQLREIDKIKEKYCKS